MGFQGGAGSTLEKLGADEITQMWGGYGSGLWGETIVKSFVPEANAKPSSAQPQKSTDSSSQLSGSSGAGGGSTVGGLLSEGAPVVH